MGHFVAAQIASVVRSNEIEDSRYVKVVIDRTSRWAIPENVPLSFSFIWICIEKSAKRERLGLASRSIE
jgi:hypothetical protein